MIAEEHEVAPRGVSEPLLRAVPNSARRILEVGCARGEFGSRLKRLDVKRTVYGIERNPKAAGAARQALDSVFEIDVERDDPPLEPGTIDCIVYSDVLEHLGDPWSVLRRHRALLSADGMILCSIRNLQHHAVVAQLLRGDLRYDPGGPGFFTFATAIKLLLDSGYEPDLIDTIDVAGADTLIEAARPLLASLRANPARSARYLNAHRLILSGRPLRDPDPAMEVPLTFVACVNDEAQLDSNLLHSPCLRAPGPHQVLLFRGCATAAEGLNAGIAQAVNDLVVLVHQDVYLPEGWPARLFEQWQEAQRQGGRVGVAGVFGIDSASPTDGRRGRVIDRDYLLATGDALPSDMDVIDELVMVVPRDTPLRFDPSLGWHLYGTDLCLSAGQRGLRVVVLDALCYHNSLTSLQVPPDYQLSEDVIARKWPDLLPIRTLCSVIGSDSTDRRLAELEGQLDETLRQLDVLRSERKLEQDETALRIASMEASPFWRAREFYARVRARLRRG